MKQAFMYGNRQHCGGFSFVFMYIFVIEEMNFQMKRGENMREEPKQRFVKEL